MATSNYTVIKSFDDNQPVLRPNEIRQNPQIGLIQSILDGKEDQAVMVMRILVALSEVAGREVDCNQNLENNLVRLYRRNIDELAMIARSVLSTAKRVHTDG